MDVAVLETYFAPVDFGLSILKLIVVTEKVEGETILLGRAQRNRFMRVIGGLPPRGARAGFAVGRGGLGWGGMKWGLRMESGTECGEGVSCSLALGPGPSAGVTRVVTHPLWSDTGSLESWLLVLEVEEMLPLLYSFEEE